MTAQILKSLGLGFTPKQIIDYLVRRFPEQRKAIEQATAMGYGADQILQFITKKTKEPLTQEGMTAAEKAYQNDQSRTNKDLSRFLKNIGPVAAIAAPYVAPSIQQGIESFLSPNQPMPQGPETPQTPSPQMETPGQQIGNMIRGETPNQPIPQGTEQGESVLPTPEMLTPPAQRQPNLYRDMVGDVDFNSLSPIKQQELRHASLIADKLQREGKGPKDPEVKKLAQKIKKILTQESVAEREINRFDQSQLEQQNTAKPETNPAQTEINTAETPDLPREKITSELNESRRNLIEPTKIESPTQEKKGDTVITPDGEIGQIKGISGNQFLIEENGKVKKVPMSELRSQPQAIKNAKIIFDPSSVPENTKSAALAISLPLPDRSAIVNMFNDGSFYIYKRKDGKPIDEEVVRRIVDGFDHPISSGETFMGMWNTEQGDSRGAASYKELVAQAQKLGDPDDPNKSLVFEKITDSFTHGYLSKFLESLKEANKHYGAKPKKKKKAE